MKRILVALILAAASTAAIAACYTQTIIGPNGQVTICTTCCVGNSCQTTCC